LFIKIKKKNKKKNKKNEKEKEKRILPAEDGIRIRV
jgi:hypothetical protein